MFEPYTYSQSKFNQSFETLVYQYTSLQLAFYPQLYVFLFFVSVFWICPDAIYFPDFLIYNKT